MSFGFDDLMKKCVTCNGSGKEAPAPSSGGGGGFGTQRYKLDGDDHCETCGGDGYVELTESGEALKRFIRILKKRGQA